MDALPQLALLGVMTGLLAGGVILVFRAAIEWILSRALPVHAENFEALGVTWRLLLPVCGALAIGVALNGLPQGSRRVGVVHVMERLSRHQGNLPLRGAWIQFFGGIAALATGQSGGREGPAIHLGSAAASFLGRAFRLPNNSMRTLVACGTAAAIAGSFNTPIAGVIFAMEVVMMEYAISSFIPVIVAAVTATLLTRAIIGSEPAFLVPAQELQSLIEIPFIILAGVLIGCVAAGYIALVQQFARLAQWPYWRRATLAGVLTGLAAVVAPEVMGIGYDTLSLTMLGQVGVTTLVVLVLAKCVTSAAAVGLGLPVGLIGPTLLIGASLGGALAVLGTTLVADAPSHPALYVMLGMSAMMAAVLQAPLAALMAILELTASPSIILPAMLAIVVATLTTSEVFKQQSVFLTTLRTLGLQYPPDPATLHLQRVGVAAVMERRLQRLPARTGVADALEALADDPRWIVVEVEPGVAQCVLNASDLRLHLDRVDDDTVAVDLLEVPGMRKDTADLDVRATLHEAHERLNSENAEALCVRRTSAPLIAPIIGIVTREDIDNYRNVS